MGKRLRMSAKQARKCLQLLEIEKLVDFEILDIGADGQLKKKRKREEIIPIGGGRPQAPPPPQANEVYWSGGRAGNVPAPLGPRRFVEASRGRRRGRVAAPPRPRRG